MIKISNSELTVWKSAEFLHPVLNTTASTVLYFNHNMNKHVDDAIMVRNTSDDNHNLNYTMDRNGTNFYGFRLDGTQTKNTTAIRIYRFASPAALCQVKLICYGD